MRGYIRWQECLNEFMVYSPWTIGYGLWTTISTFTFENVKIMQESKRQKQVASLLNEEMNTIFQKLGLNMIGGGMVSISSVKVTPDLLEARFYLSFFQANDKEAALKKIADRHHEIKKELAASVRHQLRNIPVLKFFADDTLDHVFKMEELFKKIEDERKNSNQ